MATSLRCESGAAHLHSNLSAYRSYIRLLTFCMYRHVKKKWSRYRPGVAQRVGRGTALLFHDRGTRRGEWSAARPGRTLPPGKTWYPFYRRLGGPHGLSGRVKNLVPIGIRSRTVQPVVSRYTDWATEPTLTVMYIYLYNKRQVCVFYLRFRLYGHANNLWCGSVT